MIYKDFHGLQISGLGLGALRFVPAAGDPERIDREKGQRVVDEALERGVNYIDTSHTYQDGDSERFLGEALAKYPRDSYYLATKFYVTYRTDLEQLFEEQLGRCRTDYFDFYLFHCLDERTAGLYSDEQKGYLEFLLRQREKGRIRFIGFSSHASTQVLSRFLDWYDGFDMALIQLNYLDWKLLDGKGQYEILTDHHIPVWVMEPLKGGRLAQLNPEAAAVLKEAAPDRSLASWGFRFLQGLPNVHTVLSGMSAPEQVADNVKTYEKWEPLTPAESAALERAADIFLKTMGVPCSGCRYCCGDCPAKLDIPLLIQAYNERKISGSDWKIPGLAGTQSASGCLQCGNCRKRCPQKIDIPAIMREISGAAY